MFFLFVIVLFFEHRSLRRTIYRLVMLFSNPRLNDSVGQAPHFLTALSFLNNASLNNRDWLSRGEVYESSFLFFSFTLLIS
jgi:hypothetical protein